MIRRTVLVLFALASLLIAGCQASEVEPKADEPATSGKAPEAPAPETPKTEAKSGESSTTAELAKCDGCGTEVPKAELASHDGMMLCKTCMKGHQH